jgi:ABC-type Mn2+/Zn2+ transport system ATPase subunit
MPIDLRQRSFPHRLIGAVALRTATHKEVEADRGATGEAIAVVALSDVATGLGGTPVRRRSGVGLLKPIAGRVERRQGLSISYVPQREHIDRIIPVTVLEVVLMGPGAKAPALRRIRGNERDAADRTLALLGIESLSGNLFRSLSTGQQQRVLLARALATDPDVLVLDEPTVGMDVASEAAMIDFLRDLNRRRRVTILIVTHLLPIVLNLSSAIMLMAPNGILQGAVDDVLQEDRLTALYGVPVRLGRVAGQQTLVVERGKALNA